VDRVDIGKSKLAQKNFQYEKGFIQLDKSVLRHGTFLMLANVDFDN
jgi:hypothetical protein